MNSLREIFLANALRRRRQNKMFDTWEFAEIDEQDVFFARKILEVWDEIRDESDDENFTRGTE